MSENVVRRSGVRKKKRRFLGNRYTKRNLFATEDVEEDISSQLSAPRRSGIRKKKRLFRGNQYMKPNRLPTEDIKEDISAQLSISEDNNESLKTPYVPLQFVNLKNTHVPAMNTKPGSFNWRPYLRKQGFSAAPVSCFKHVALSNCWDSIVSDVLVEVRSPDCKTCCTTTPCCYWIAAVIKVCGYWGLLRYEGFDKISPHYFNVPDKWVNLCTEPHIHPIGWCRENGKPLVPPKSVERKIDPWKEFLMERMTGHRTLPPDFSFKIEEHTHNTLKKEMRLEVVDKGYISAVCSAVVTEVVGGRLHIKYAESEDEGFWCHERSPLIHPVGWAQIIGHSLRARPEYARQSLKKTLYRTFDSNDATWDMFLPVYNPATKLKFKKGMKLEAIDPLNLSTICVATVTQVLRNNYLMIGIDGMMASNGSDCFCYHASSPCIFPVGFCESNQIPLTTPSNHKGEFKWSEYLKKTKSEAASVDLFHRDVPDHGFKEGMYLEAVDLMEPRLICVAYVTKVVGRLLKVHFDGWENDYDQWCDCESPDLFPIGWCDVLGYKLEPPRVDGSEDKKKKKPIVKRRKRRHLAKKPTSGDDSPDVPQENHKSEDDADFKDLSRENSILTLEDSSSNSFFEKKKTQTTKKSSENPPNGKRGRGRPPLNKSDSLKGTQQTKKIASVDKPTPSSSTELKKPIAKKLTFEEEAPIPPQKRFKTRKRNRKNLTPAIITVADSDSSSSSFDAVSSYLGNEWEAFTLSENEG